MPSSRMRPFGTVFENQLRKLIIEPLQSPSEPDSAECKDVVRMAQLITSLAVPHPNGRFPIQFFVTTSHSGVRNEEEYSDFKR